jgi:hypothetical protein
VALARRPVPAHFRLEWVVGIEYSVADSVLRWVSGPGYRVIDSMLNWVLGTEYSVIDSMLTWVLGTEYWVVDLVPRRLEPRRASALANIRSQCPHI